MIKTKLTPVRYPGGKSNALKVLDKDMVKDFSEYREPFFGGGSIGLYLMQYNKTAEYWINDKFYPVYCFWDCLYEMPEKMIKFLVDVKEAYSVSNDEVGRREGNKKIPSKSALKAKELHINCRTEITESMQKQDKFRTACLWYILNKTSYSGMSLIGSYAPLAWDQNFTISSINKIESVSELLHSIKSTVKITNLDYSEMLGNEGDNVFIFFDPPYKIQHNLYGDNGNMHEGFDHKLFSVKVKNCHHKWLITYNEDDEIKKWFEGGHYYYKSWNLTYTMKAAKRNENETADIKVDATLSEDEKEKMRIEIRKHNDTNKCGKKGKELLISNYPLK